MKESSNTNENQLGYNETGSTMGLHDFDSPTYYKNTDGSPLGISVQHLVMYLFGEQPPLLSEAISSTIQKHLWLKEEFENMETVKNNLVDIEKSIDFGPSQECIDKILGSLRE